MACALSTPDRLVPDTHAYTHDGQRQLPRDRPDIRAQLTGSFTYIGSAVHKELQDVSITAKARQGNPKGITHPLHS
jgi:hypothetical protein